MADPLELLQARTGGEELRVNKVLDALSRIPQHYNLRVIMEQVNTLKSVNFAERLLMGLLDYLNPRERFTLMYLDKRLAILKNDTLHRHVIDKIWPLLPVDDVMSVAELTESTHSLRWRVIREGRVRFEGKSEELRTRQLSFLLRYIYSPGKHGFEGKQEAVAAGYLDRLEGIVSEHIAREILSADDITTMIAREKLTELLVAHNQHWNEAPAAPVAIAPVEVPPQVEGEPGHSPIAVLVARQQELLRQLSEVTQQLSALLAQ